MPYSKLLACHPVEEAVVHKVQAAEREESGFRNVLLRYGRVLRPHEHHSYAG
jgi:hypothetical protein